MPSPGNARFSSENRCNPCTYVLARFKLPPPRLAPPAGVENLGIPLLHFTLSRSLSVGRSRTFKLKTWVQNALGMEPASRFHSGDQVGPHRQAGRMSHTGQVMHIGGAIKFLSKWPPDLPGSRTLLHAGPGCWQRPEGPLAPQPAENKLMQKKKKKNPALWPLFPCLMGKL